MGDRRSRTSREPMLGAAWAAAGLLLLGCSGPTALPAEEGARLAATENAIASSPTSAGSGRTLTILAHESYNVEPELIERFEAEQGAQVRILKLPDAGQALNRAILTRDRPEADLLFGVDNTFLSRALEADILEAYQAEGLADVPEAYRLDPSHRLTPIDYGDVCLNIDRRYFGEGGLPIPQSLEALTAPVYRDMLVVENPEGSSPGLAFMLATIGALGEDRWLDFWRALDANGVKVVEDWGSAYYTEFSGSSGRGPRPIVVSYASSPAAEVAFADPPPSEAPTAAIVAPGTCFRQIEFAGLLKGAPNPDLARAWIELMLGPDYQRALPLSQFVFPVQPDTPLPAVFLEHAELVEEPVSLPPEQIAARRDAWIEAWSETVLR